MKSFFLLGRNPSLSVAEILSYLDVRNIEVQDWELNGNALLIDSEQRLDFKSMINSLGGTIAAGTASITGSQEEVLDFIEKKDICPWKENKFDYSVIAFCERDFEEVIIDAMKSSFKLNKVRAMIKPSLGVVAIQNGARASGTPTKLLTRDKLYFIFEGIETSFGTIAAVFDADASEKRDMNKPVRREELAISPRMAKILINLAELKPGQTVIDPFCGIGGVMQEAMLQDINAIGVDLDSSALEGARQNDRWLKKTYHPTATSTFILGDSQRVNISPADGVATEPSLGQLLKNIVPKEEAYKMQKRFEDLMIGVIKNSKKSLHRGAKIAFTAPYIQTHHARIGCNSKRILEETGLKMSIIKNGKNLAYPISELRNKKVVSREMFVFEY
ncbi:MAG: hypothetical protein AABW59_02690 [archaeon]